MKCRSSDELAIDKKKFNFKCKAHGLINNYFLAQNRLTEIKEKRFKN